MLSRSFIGWLICAVTVSACGTHEPDEATQERGRVAPEPTHAQKPDPRWSGDPAEDLAEALEDAVEEAAELDGDESGAWSLVAGNFSLSGTDEYSALAFGSCDERPGSFDYCDGGCTCEVNEGDCDSDDECASGLVCMRDTGGLFGFDPEVDVCMVQCAPEANGTPDFCSPECPCDAGEADCDEDEDCAPGNICAKNVGASFGYAPDVDVCIDACDPILNGDWDFCSSECPCTDGQADCDHDEDCAPGHACTRNVGADYGFPADMDVCVAIVLPAESFAGRVIDGRGDPVFGATVTINGTEVTTGEDGRFGLTTDAALDSRYVINVEKRGHVPSSQIHVGGGVGDLDIILRRAEIIVINPKQPADLEDSRGTRIALPANALVDANGEPPKGPVRVEMYTYDITRESMVGDMSAIDESGEIVMLESIGAISADFVGTDGTKFQLAPGKTATVSLTVPAGVTFQGMIDMWYFDMAQGRWIEEGTGIVQGDTAIATFSHFSVHNFDVKRNDPACVQINVPDALAPLNGSVPARVVVPPPFPSNRVVTLERGANALYNLPPNVTIEIFIPTDAATPLVPVNTGNPWGRTGEPPFPYNDCNGRVTLPTDIPGQLTGFAFLQSRQAHGGITVSVRDGAGIEVASTVTDASGRYSVDGLPPGTYEVFLAHAGFLEVRVGGIIVTAAKVSFMPCVQLLGGDVNEDDRIDTLDLQILFDAAPGQSVPPGDIRDVNGDGQLDDVDVSITNKNQGKVGPISASSGDSRCGSEDLPSVLIYEDYPYDANNPFFTAAASLGLQTIMVQGSPTEFAARYASQPWGIVAIDSPGFALPAQVKSAVTDRTLLDQPLLFSHWRLNGEPDMQAALGVSTINYITPEPISPVAGASVNFFTYSDVFPAPLTPVDTFVDNGDYLTTTASGEIALIGNSPSEGLLAITNNRSSLVLGFLPADFTGGDGDGDGTRDIVELITNMFVWYQDGSP